MYFASQELPQAAFDCGDPRSFTTTASVPAGASLGSLKLGGRLSSDNRVNDILVNGVSTGQGFEGFSAWSALVLTAADGLTTGTNTITFLVQNDSTPSQNPTGLIVDWAEPGDVDRFLWTGNEYNAENDTTTFGDGGTRVWGHDVFYQQDPAQQFTNPYIYGNNNPLTWIDYNGDNANFGGSGFDYLRGGTSVDITGRSLSFTNDDLWSTMTAPRANNSAFGRSGVELQRYYDNVQNVVETPETRAAAARNRASYVEWAEWNTGWKGALNAGYQIKQGAEEGAYAGLLANAKAWTFGYSDTVNAEYDRAWDKSGLGGTWAETGSNVFANISRDSFIGAVGGGSASAYRAGGSSAYLYAARGVQLYDYGSGAYDVAHGIGQVRQGNNWGYLQIAGGGLSAFNAGDISLKVDDLSSVGSLGRPARATGGLSIGAPTVGQLRTEGLRDAHHIIQNKAVIHLPGYNPRLAPGVHLLGPVNRVSTPHFNTRAIQRQLGGGTYGAERRIGYKALRRSGQYTQQEARQAIERADLYFQSIGVNRGTPTRIPGDRR